MTPHNPMPQQEGMAAEVFSTNTKGCLLHRNILYNDLFLSIFII